MFFTLQFHCLLNVYRLKKMIRKKFALITVEGRGGCQIVPSAYIYQKNVHNKYRPITASTETFDNVVIFNDVKKPEAIKITCFGGK